MRIIILLFIGICLLGMGCQEKLKSRPEIFTEDDVAIEVGKSVEILYSDSAVVRVRVKGPVLHNYVDLNDPKQVFPEGVLVDFFNEKGDITSTLTAKNAVRAQKKGVITCRDSVILVTTKQEKLETEELIWNENDQRLTTNKFVKVSKPEEVIYGFGLEADQDFSYWRILVPKGKLKASEVEK